MVGEMVLFYKKELQKVLKLNTNLTGWGAGQPGFPCLVGLKLDFGIFINSGCIKKKIISVNS